VKYCSECGSPLKLRVPHGDHLPRHICESCGVIHYQNPKLVTGCILEWDNKVLLCRRAIEPRFGLWTVPAGFMENNETTIQAAKRETQEEANALVEDAYIFALFNLPHISQVYIMFRGSLKDGQASPGAESLEIGLFPEQHIPWHELAFPVIHQSLALYFKDRKSGRFGMHMGDIVRRPGQSL